ncbi:MAG: aminotransferase class III-fold pyridoxal phosphate-dependent enzyme, partial [Singulisphaera sp.]
GATAEGRLYEIPLEPEAILADPVAAMTYMEQATQMAAEWGAKVVGLGSITGVIGGQGTYLAERAPIAVTTGNSLTVFATLQNLYHICDEAHVDLSREAVAVIGIPGSIASAVAKLLAPQCRELILVGRRKSSRADQLAAELGGEMVLDIPTALARARVIVSATSTGSCIEQKWLQPGSIVVDVGVPTDVCGANPERPDCLIISGGLARVPETMPLDSMFLGFHHGIVPCCLGETMVLGLENRPDNFSLGRNLDVDNVLEIGAIAKQHGFDFSRLYSFGLELPATALVQYNKALSRSRRTASVPRSLTAATNGHSAGGLIDRGTTKASAARPQHDLQALAENAARLHARYINPVLVTLAGKSGAMKTFVAGEGNYLRDHTGRRYLDLVAGFGSLNLGHNHPRVVEALTGALAQQAPGFAQSAVNPYAAALAERLIQVAPPGLEMVFFANSGSEAVEAALKLARIATGRAGFLHCDRSYHGKSLGALSVTGNPTYQKPFGPLLSDCTSIPFGNLAALETALSSRRFAAFIVEPVQAEGGMIVPPDGYLREAQRLCHAAGTLFIVDEVQTGLGRTGEMFAVDHDGAQPDIMTLAKSLGGGLMPIGAMLCRRDLWHKAYGSLQNFALHTSTFGGGSLACAAGLAALRVLEDEHLVEHCQARARQLRAGLEAIAQRYQLVKEVRGRGLLLGIEFNRLPESLITHWKQTQASGIGEFVAPQLGELIESIVSLYTMHNLLQEFGIYTQIARSNSMVLRIQPPLTITEDEVEQVISALDQVIGSVDFAKNVVGDLISKTTLGTHEGGKDRSSPTVEASIP